MSYFMFDRKEYRPSGYAERACLLVSYRLPLLRHCFVLCHEAADVQTASASADIMIFFLSEAERLAHEAVGDSQAFVLIHSGQSIRRRADLHIHVFVVQQRWQKAWLYCVLGVKNVVFVFYKAGCRVFGL